MATTTKKTAAAAKAAAKTTEAAKTEKAEALRDRNLAAGTAIAKAMRVEGLSVTLSPSGHEFKIVEDGRTLVFAHVLSSGAYRLHLRHWGGDEKVTAQTVAAAAKLVKTAGKRTPKPTKEKPAKPAAKKAAQPVEPPAAVRAAQEQDDEPRMLGTDTRDLEAVSA